MNTRELVGKRMLECRLACKMTQRDVAKLLNVAQPVYQRYEKGVFECSYDILIQLCTIFDVSADFLLGLSEI